MGDDIDLNDLNNHVPDSQATHTAPVAVNSEDINLNNPSNEVPNVDVQQVTPTGEAQQPGYINPKAAAIVGGAAGKGIAGAYGTKYAYDALKNRNVPVEPKVVKPAPGEMIEIPKNLPSTEFESPEISVPESDYYSEHGFGEPAVKSANINQDISDIHSNARNLGMMGKEAPLAENAQVLGNSRIATLKGSDLTPSNAQRIAARQIQLEEARKAVADQIQKQQLSDAAKKEAQRAYLAKQGPANVLEEAQQAARLKAAKEAEPIISKVASSPAFTGVGGKILNTAVPVLAGAGAASEAADAYNRINRGDWGGAAISGLGALGSAASMLPFPPAKIIGGGLGMAAPALNYGIDYIKNKNKNPAVSVGRAQVHKAGGLVYLR